MFTIQNYLHGKNGLKNGPGLVEISVFSATFSMSSNEGALQDFIGCGNTTDIYTHRPPAAGETACPQKIVGSVRSAYVWRNRAVVTPANDALLDILISFYHDS